MNAVCDALTNVIAVVDRQIETKEKVDYASSLTRLIESLTDVIKPGWQERVPETMFSDELLRHIDECPTPEQYTHDMRQLAARETIGVTAAITPFEILAEELRAKCPPEFAYLVGDVKPVTIPPHPSAPQSAGV